MADSRQPPSDDPNVRRLVDAGNRAGSPPLPSDHPFIEAIRRVPADEIARAAETAADIQESTPPRTRLGKTEAKIRALNAASESADQSLRTMREVRLQAAWDEHLKELRASARSGEAAAAQELALLGVIASEAEAANERAERAEQRALDAEAREAERDKRDRFMVKLTVASVCVAVLSFIAAVVAIYVAVQAA